MSEVPDDLLVGEIRAAYASSARDWASGPATIYRHLADALVDAAAGGFADGQVLDLGAGTGVASEALRRVGARPVGADLAVEMLAHGRATRPPGVAGDARSLPFADGAFDGVVAAFSLNHLPDPVRALAECRRILGAGGLLLASTFPNRQDHPAKAVVDQVLERHGYRRPAWYDAVKTTIAELTGEPANLTAAARTAGFASSQVDHLDVEVGLDDPRRAVAWRLGMPQVLGFVAGLDEAERTELHRAAVEQLTGPLPSWVRMLVLRASTG